MDIPILVYSDPPQTAIVHVIRSGPPIMQFKLFVGAASDDSGVHHFVSIMANLGPHKAIVIDSVNGARSGYMIEKITVRRSSFDLG